MAVVTHDHSGSAGIVVEAVLASPFVLAAAIYVVATVRARGRGRPWPWRRTAAWMVGVGCAALGFLQPGVLAHGSFTAHMAAHLLVGMAAPLFLVMAAPVTLALRSLHATPARRVSRVLRSRPVRLISHPVVAALLNVGGMWIVYSTALFDLMWQVPLVHTIVMTHFLLVGYLYTAALVGTDPAPHRATTLVRAVVLVLSLAAHGILAKFLYAYPPQGVAALDARAGAQLMFYGGDVVDVVLIVLLCAQWYRATGRDLAREERAAGLASSSHGSGLRNPPLAGGT